MKPDKARNAGVAKPKIGKLWRKYLNLYIFVILCYCNCKHI